MDRPPVPAFQSAAAVLKAQNDQGLPAGQASSSLRNAAGGQPSIPRSPAASTNGSNGISGKSFNEVAVGANGSNGNNGVPEGTVLNNGNAVATSNGQVSGTNGNAEAGPSKVKPINRPAGSKNSIVYSAVQRRNPVLAQIKNVGTEIGDIVADYQVGTHNGVLFLSLKYHRLHPEYIHQRIERMKNMYNVRILLVHCDINEPQQTIRELSKIAIVNHLTMIVAWSAEEAGQYLTTFKAYEHKSDDTLKEKVHQEYHEQLQHVLTSGKKVNKTDADNLASQFGSFANIARQPSKLLSNVKGLGATKVTSLLDAFNKPFLVGGLKRTSDEQMEFEIGSKRSVPAKNGSAVLGKRSAPTAEDEETEKEEVGSPDWPDSPPPQARESASDARSRDRAPSRSPGLSPELQPSTEHDAEPLDAGTAWNDPLDDADDEDDDATEEDAPSRKRLRRNDDS